MPYLSYGFSSFFGAALGRLFAERPQFLRRHVHENAIGAGLKTLALTGAGLCWLPQSLIQAELNAGLLVNASTTTDWTMDLEIHLYRHLGSQSKLVKNFWRSAEALLRTQVPLPVRQRMI
ncbi:LysR substrate-binding domain-containing protein [Rhizobium sp. S95]|uniref:LysR substrate-binding domain-containing protein n=1 Tax=Ciceribacter sichuanensis TaxID=2949647 RepID=A0AAJ1F662_9HYPH|nr:LysR substrate-binding domain-containing protein [Ciceribacter sp. S95]MCO5958580.1 LysR substrate-binding domain-containing protein [Ciceribacter sp. S101]